MSLFFESYSILVVLLWCTALRKAGHVIVHQGSYPFSYKTGRSRYEWRGRRLFRWMLLKLNPDVRIEEISIAETNAYSWVSNRKTPEVVDALTERIQKSLPYRIFHRIAKDPSLLRFYQHFLAKGYVNNSISFFMTAEALQRQYQHLIVIPTSRFTEIIADVYAGMPDLKMYHLRTRFWNRVKDMAGTLIYLGLFVWTPSLFIVRELVKGGIDLKNTLPVQADVLYPVVNGFDHSLEKKGAAFIPDDYFAGQKPGAKRFDAAFFFNRRQYGRDDSIRKASLKWLNSKSIPWFDIKQQRLKPVVLLTALGIQARVMAGFLMIFWRAGGVSLYYSISFRGLNRYLKKLNELAWIKPKVEFCRNDAVSEHVINTIVSNTCGIKTVGMQHNSTAGPYVWPQLCYVHFNRYCVYSDAHVRLHSPQWEDLEIVRTGSALSDRVLAIASDTKAIEAVRQKMECLCRPRKYIVLMAFPNPGNDYSLKEKWSEVHGALAEVVQSAMDVNVFLRFRSHEQVNCPEARPLAALADLDDRIIIDHENFSTHQIMSVCDAYITSSHSSGMIEAAVMGKKCFSFDYMGTAAHCFARYGKDLVVSDREGLLKVFRGLENKFNDFDCDWDLLKQEYNFGNDGHCMERIQGAISTLLQDTK